MKISKIEMLHADAGWRPWSFVRIETDGGLVGWSECTDSHGSPRGMEGVVKDLGPLLLGQDPRRIGKLLQDMHSRTRQSYGSIIQKAIAGIENALWDIKGKALGVPVYELLGGALRERIELYWSHCGTSRVRAWNLVRKPAIASLADVAPFCREVRESGFKTVKTNIAIFGATPFVYMPGFFKSEGGPERNATPAILSGIEKWVDALRSGLGDGIGIGLDLNFNFKTDGYIKIGHILEKYNLTWLEIDTYDPLALRQIKDAIAIPVTSCENLYGARQFLPFFQNHSMDTAAIDVIWNGITESRRIAELAEIHEMNICPHNYNGHLSTAISLQFCAAIPNLRIAEVDVDDVPWRDSLFTAKPNVQDGFYQLSDGPGWGMDVDENVLAEHKWPRE